MNYVLSYNKRGDTFMLLSKHPIFQNKELIVNVFDDYIIIKIPTIYSNEKTYKTQKTNNSDKWRTISFTDIKMKKGRFNIDVEDISEDYIIIDF